MIVDTELKDRSIENLKKYFEVADGAKEILIDYSLGFERDYISDLYERLFANGKIVRVINYKDPFDLAKAKVNKTFIEEDTKQFSSIPVDKPIELFKISDNPFTVYIRDEQYYKGKIIRVEKCEEGKPIITAQRRQNSSEIEITSKYEPDKTEDEIRYAIWVLSNAIKPYVHLLDIKPDEAVWLSKDYLKNTLDGIKDEIAEKDASLMRLYIQHQYLPLSMLKDSVPHKIRANSFPKKFKIGEKEFEVEIERIAQYIGIVNTPEIAKRKLISGNEEWQIESSDSILHKKTVKISEIEDEFARDLLEGKYQIKL